MGIDQNKLVYFKNMVSHSFYAFHTPFFNTNISLQSHEELWQTAARELTNIIKQIIEFAKMVPGFMTGFNQEDQITLLKKGKSKLS